MELVPNDIEFCRSLEEKLNHSAPFTQNELTNIKDLDLRYVSSIDEIKYCTGLENLSIMYSDIENLELLGQLNDLKSLVIVATPIRSIDFIGNLKRLEKLVAQFTFIEEATAIMKRTDLKSIAILGNPWSSDFNEELTNYSFEKQDDKFLSLSYSSEKIWEFSKKMSKEGCCFAYIDTRPFLVRPGKPRLPNSECDFISISMSYLEHMLKSENLTVEQLFLMFSERTIDMPYRQFELNNRYEIGNVRQASNWIDQGKFASEERILLKKFINHFPHAYFYNEDENILIEEGNKFNMSFPSWFTEIRQTVAFIFPDYISTIRIDEFSLNQEFYEFVENGWFTFELYGTPGTDEELLIDNEKVLYAIGYQRSYVICINVKGEDKRVYMYNQADLGIESDLAHPIFNSYIEMLTNINSVKLENGRIIRAVKN